MRAALPRRPGAAAHRQGSATAPQLLAAAAGPSTSRQGAEGRDQHGAVMQDVAAEAAAARAEAASRRRGLLLAAAVATVWALLVAAHVTARPLFLARPPITRWVVAPCCLLPGGGCLAPAACAPRLRWPRPTHKLLHACLQPAALPSLQPISWLQARCRFF